MAAAGDNARSTSRSLRLFAALVEAEALRYAPYASRRAEADLVLAFRGGATPAESVSDFLARIYRAGRVDGTCFVLAGVYLTRFFRSRAAIKARIKVEPATAHRLAAVALFVGAKFGGHPHKKWTAVFETCSGRAIRAAEMADLERRFLRAIDYRLYVRAEEFDWFIRVMEAGPSAPAPPPATVADLLAGERKASGDEDERRRIRPRLPTPAVVVHTPLADCCGGKRKAAGEEDESRRIRPHLPTPAVVPPPVADCRGEKRKAAGEEDEHRRIRPRLPTPAVVPAN
jgi:hypothetical protein